MKLSINKLLIGLLFVFSLVLIPAGVAKANVYTAVCTRENDNLDMDRWFNFSLNVTVNSPMSLTASGGVSINNGCDNDIVVYVHSDQDGTDRTLFSGSISSSPGGARTFSFNTGGYHYIDFTVNISANKNHNYFIFNGSIFHFVLPTPPALPDPTVTITANGVAGNITVPYNAAVPISWTSTNATTCTCTYGPSNLSCGTGAAFIGNSTPAVPINIPSNFTATTTINVTCSN